MSKKENVIRDELKITGDGFYCFFPFERLDKHRKGIFKVGYTTTTISNRAENYHTYFPRGFYIVASLEKLYSKGVVRNGYSKDMFYKMVEDRLFKLLEHYGAEQIKTTTRVMRDSKSEWFYSNVKTIHTAFSDINKEYGGDLNLFHLRGLSHFADANQNKKHYSAEIYYPLQYMAGFHTKTFINHDDYMTPKYAWENIKHIIPKDKIIWEAFYGDGSSGKYLEKLGFNVVHEPVDFFENNLGEVIVSNPPFSKCKEIMKRLKELDKPFILILPVSKMNTSYLRENYKNDKLQIVIPRKRIQFEKMVDGVKVAKFKNACNFDCLYYCYKIGLEKDIIWLE